MQHLSDIIFCYVMVQKEHEVARKEGNWPQSVIFKANLSSLCAMDLKITSWVFANTSATSLPQICLTETRNMQASVLPQTVTISLSEVSLKSFTWSFGSNTRQYWLSSPRARSKSGAAKLSRSRGRTMLLLLQNWTLWYQRGSSAHLLQDQLKL